MISEMEGMERKKGYNGVLVSLTVEFSSRHVCAGDHPGALQFHGQSQQQWPHPAQLLYTTTGFCFKSAARSQWYRPKNESNVSTPLSVMVELSVTLSCVAWLELWREPGLHLFLVLGIEMEI